MLPLALPRVRQRSPGSRVITGPRVVSTLAMPCASCTLAVTSAPFHKRTPLSVARCMKPVITLFGSTNPSVGLKLPPRMSSARRMRHAAQNLSGRKQFHRLYATRHLQLVIGPQVGQVLLTGSHEQVALRTIAAGAAGGLLEAGKKVESSTATGGC